MKTDKLINKVYKIISMMWAIHYDIRNERFSAAYTSIALVRVHLWELKRDVNVARNGSHIVGIGKVKKEGSDGK